ncbi:MAG: hypothetical protein RQ966_04565 [Acetobacteraceae bacterium]|nr:hypothetical protein [Acetobacteraceae bacterium]
MPDPVPMQPAATSPGPDSEAVATSLRERIGEAVGKLLVLRVTTIIGEVSATGAGQFGEVTGLSLGTQGQLVACTSFDMLLGDGSVIMSPAFTKDPDLRALHADSVNQAHAIREKSVALLKDMLDTFEGLVDRTGAPRAG